MISSTNGISLSQQSRKKPIEENRRPTDVLFIPLLAIVFSAWLGVGCYVLTTEPAEEELTTEYGGYYENRGYTNEADYLRTIFKNYTRILDTSSQVMQKWYIALAIPLAMIVSLVLMALYIYLIKTVASKGVCIAALACLMLNFFIVIVDFLRCVIRDSDEKKYFPYIVYAIAGGKLLYAIYLIVVMCIANKVKMLSLTELVKEACSGILRCPAMIPFAIIINVLLIFVALFTILVFNTLILLPLTTTVITLHTFNLIGGAFILSFIVYFATMVISEGAIHVYWSQDQGKPYDVSVYRSILRVIRNHLGTISYAATGFLPLICASIAAVRNNSTAQHENICIRFFSKIAAIYYISYFSLIHTLIYGYDFKDSTRKVFEIIPGNYAFYLIAVEIGHNVRNVGIVILMFLWTFAITIVLHVVFNIDLDDIIYVTMVILITLSSVGVTLYLLLDTYLHTLLIHKLTRNCSSQGQNGSANFL